MNYKSLTYFNNISSILKLKDFLKIRPLKYSMRKISTTVRSNDNSSESVEAISKDDDEELLTKLRNKSALNSKHYLTFHKLPPKLTKNEKYVMPLRVYRKLFGHNGMSADIDLKALWPSTEEMEMEKECERVEFPLSVQEMIALAQKEKEEEEREIMDKQNEILENMKHLDKWIAEVKERKRKEEMDAHIALLKKEKQIEEVRQIFGYNISPYDERFQQALEKKVEDDKKRLKKEKKLKKQQEMLQKLQKEANEEVKAMEEDTLHGSSIVEGTHNPKIKND